MKRFVVIIAAGLMFATLGVRVVNAQTVRSEAAEHPRIAAAIRELEEAVRYMEAAPHDFGGHKAAAVRDSRLAINQLRLALAYRAARDRR